MIQLLQKGPQQPHSSLVALRHLSRLHLICVYLDLLLESAAVLLLSLPQELHDSLAQASILEENLDPPWGDLQFRHPVDVELVAPGFEALPLCRNRLVDIDESVKVDGGGRIIVNLLQMYTSQN